MHHRNHEFPDVPNIYQSADVVVPASGCAELLLVEVEGDGLLVLVGVDVVAELDGEEEEELLEDCDELEDGEDVALLLSSDCLLSDVCDDSDAVGVPVLVREGRGLSESVSDCDGTGTELFDGLTMLRTTWSVPCPSVSAYMMPAVPPTAMSALTAPTISTLRFFLCNRAVSTVFVDAW